MNNQPKNQMIRGSRGKAITISGTPEWKNWLSDLARTERTSVSGLIDKLACEHGKRIDFKPAPFRGVR